MKKKLIKIYVQYGLDPIHYKNMTNDLFRLFNVNSSLDLDSLKKRLDEALAKETPESYSDWLKAKKTITILNNGRTLMNNEKQYCPVCGTEVKVISGDEGTCCYEPIQKIEALKEGLATRFIGNFTEDKMNKHLDALADLREVVTHVNPSEGLEMIGEPTSVVNYAKREIETLRDYQILLQNKVIQQSGEIEVLKEKLNATQEERNSWYNSFDEIRTELFRIKKERMKLPIYITAKEIKCYSIQDIDNLFKGEQK